jgi:hypothetical protein
MKKTIARRQLLACVGSACPAVLLGTAGHSQTANAMEIVDAHGRWADDEDTNQKAVFVGLDYPGATLTQPLGINPQGEIVGRYQDGAGHHGFLLSDGNWTTFDIPGASDAFPVRPKAINADREIVGQYVDANGKWHGFHMSEGSARTIEPPGATGDPWTGAWGINAQGDVVGAFSDATGIHGYLFSEGVFTPLPDAVEGSPWSSPTGINARGDIAGMYLVPGDPKMYGYVLRKGRFSKVDLASATVMICPFAINEAGDMVGHYVDPLAHGFMFRKGVYTTIDFPGAASSECNSINPHRDIVGNYRDGAGTLHGYLLRRGVPN